MEIKKVICNKHKGRKIQIVMYDRNKEEWYLSGCGCNVDKLFRV